MSMDSANDMKISYPKYISTPSVSQKEQHLWHFAILEATLAIASDNPRCCISVPTIIDTNAIHTIILSNRYRERGFTYHRSPA